MKTIFRNLLFVITSLFLVKPLFALRFPMLEEEYHEAVTYPFSIERKMSANEIKDSITTHRHNLKSGLAISTETLDDGTQVDLLIRWKLDTTRYENIDEVVTDVEISESKINGCIVFQIYPQGHFDQYHEHLISREILSHSEYSFSGPYGTVAFLSSMGMDMQLENLIQIFLLKKMMSIHFNDLNLKYFGLTSDVALQLRFNIFREIHAGFETLSALMQTENHLIFRDHFDNWKLFLPSTSINFTKTSRPR